MTGLIVESYFDQVARAVKSISIFDVGRAVDILRNMRGSGHRVWIAGNGGSAATADHFAVDLRKVGHLDAVSMGCLYPTTYAFGNDNGWEKMFSGVLDNCDNCFGLDDVFIAISYSGRSVNVIEAAHKACELKGKLVIMTGPKTNNRLAAMEADAIISIDHPDIRVVEDCHLVICHAIVGELKI